MTWLVAVLSKIVGSGALIDILARADVVRLLADEAKRPGIRAPG